MKRYFTSTFFLFLTGFLLIICVAYGIFIAVAAFAPAPATTPVDNTASHG